MALEMSIQGIGEFTEKIDRVSAELPDMAITVIDRQSNRIRREYRKRVRPVRITGNLSRRMRSMKAYPEGKDWVGGVKSYAPHFHLVEYGHRVVPIKSRRVKPVNADAKPDNSPRPGGTTYVRGRYYLKKSAGASERLFYRDVQNVVKEGMDMLT